MMGKYCMFLVGSWVLINGSVSGKNAPASVFLVHTVEELQHALRTALPGDTIRLLPGRYPAHDLIVRIPHLVIEGAGTTPDQVIVDVQHQGQGWIIIEDSVTLRNLSIRNVSFDALEEKAGVNVLRSRGFILENLMIDSVYFGILVEYAQQGIIRRCTIRTSSSGKDETTTGNGIHLWKAQNISIEKNFVEGMRDGIYLEFVKHVHLIHNLSTRNHRYGLHFMFSESSVCEENLFSANRAGVALMFSRQLKMERNRFVQNWGTASYGLLLKEIYDSEIRENWFSQNTVAIQNEGSTRIHVVDNVFHRNGWAVRFLGGAYDNLYENNTFTGNTFEVAFFGRVNQNRFERNYWSRYSGYDLDQDGFGDVPHRPVSLFAYLVQRLPETIVLLHSLFMTLLELMERIFPIFTPAELVDPSPRMKPPVHEWHNPSPAGISEPA